MHREGRRKVEIPRSTLCPSFFATSCFSLTISFNLGKYENWDLRRVKGLNTERQGKEIYRSSINKNY
jgi:hypothetical protein